jgi:transcription initiation factor IIE alpha subunit
MSIKCNHLVPRQDQNRKCNPQDSNSKTHYFVFTGHIEAKFNGAIQVDFVCKYCERRVTNFLSKEEYDTHKKVLGA